MIFARFFTLPVRSGPAIAVAMVLAVAMLIGPAGAAAQVSFSGTDVPESLEITVGKSVIVNTTGNVSRVSLADPTVADILLMSPTQIYLTAKKPGATNLTLWSGGDNVLAVYDLNCVPDVARLKEMLHMILPEETGIRVLPSGKTVALSGQVSSPASLQTAMNLARSAAGEGALNLLSVGGVQQVMLEVKVAEMSRSAMKRLGFNFNIIDGSDIYYSFLNRLTYLDDKGQLLLSEHVNGAFTRNMGSMALSGFIDALKANGLVKILAEPNMICLSGQSANFLAGGEVPIPVPAGLGMTAIEYKPFGVGLKFTPTVIGEGRINLKVEPEVSELDYTRAIVANGFTIPAISSRRASTVIELGDGQSFAIAGLIKDTLRENVNKFPALGDVPVLGSLFRSSDFEKNESELVIIVSPKLVKPMDMVNQSLPTDGMQEPNDFEFYMMGLLEGYSSDAQAASTSSAVPARQRRTGFDGQFGHSLPQ